MSFTFENNNNGKCTVSSNTISYNIKDGKQLEFLKSNIKDISMSAEKINDKKICLTLQNTSDTQKYIRYRDYADNDINIEYDTFQGDEEYYYYDNIVLPGEKIQITMYIDELSGNTEGDNIIIVCEGTDAIFDEYGNPYADWSGNSGAEGGDEGGAE